MSDNKKWFKVWASILIDPDFDSLHNQTIGVWLRLGALVSSQGKSGKITISKDQLLKRAHLLQADKSVTQDIIKNLKKINLFVTEDAMGKVTVTFKKWYKYQAFSESYDRVKKFRETSKRNATVTAHKEEEEKKKRKEIKHKYGKYKNVLLKNEEYQKLKDKFKNKVDDWIKKLDEGIELKGYKYSSHYMAILKWAEKEQSTESDGAPHYPDL